MRCLCRNLSQRRQNHLLILPEVWGPLQRIAQCSNLKEGPVRLEGPIQSWDQGWYNHWGHTVWTLLGQLILGKKAGWWIHRGTFDQSDLYLIVLLCQAWISLLHLPDPRGKRKTVLKVKCFKEDPLIGSNGALVSRCKTSERLQEGIPSLGLSLWRLSRRRARFCPCWCWRVNFPVYQQWLTCNHQWCWAVASSPK